MVPAFLSNESAAVRAVKTVKPWPAPTKETMMQGTAYILIRSVVPDADERKAFDHWYETDHLPLVLSKINVTQGWRFWSHSDPAVHYAFVEFSDMNELRQATQSENFKSLLAEYDRVWGSRVTRTRDIVEKVQHLGR